MFIAQIDDEVVNGKMFRRWGRNKNGSRLGCSFHNIGKWKNCKLVKSTLFNMIIVAWRCDYPEHPANGHYVYVGTKELNEKYKTNKPKGTTRLPKG